MPSNDFSYSNYSSLVSASAGGGWDGRMRMEGSGSISPYGVIGRVVA